MTANAGVPQFLTTLQVARPRDFPPEPGVRGGIVPTDRVWELRMRGRSRALGAGHVLRRCDVCTCEMGASARVSSTGVVQHPCDTGAAAARRPVVSRRVNESWVDRL